MGIFNITPVVGNEYFVTIGYCISEYGLNIDKIVDQKVRIVKILEEECLCVVEFFDNPDCKFKKIMTSAIFYEV